jgi:phosphohistidine phosphatase
MEVLWKVVTMETIKGLKMLLIRHSLAEDFANSDFERKLTHRGVKRAFRFFKVVKMFYPEVDYIIASEALRAKQTAEVMKKFYKNAKLIITPKLYQAGVEDFQEVLKGIDGKIAIVGHEPDLSEFARFLLNCPNLHIKLSKPSLIEIEDDVLKSQIQYKHAKTVYEGLKNDT